MKYPQLPDRAVAMALDAEFAVDLMLLGGLIGLAYYISNMKPETIEEPDYVTKFESLAGDALMEVLEKRKATVDDAVLEGLPLGEIKIQNEKIIVKFKELEQLKSDLTDDNEKTRMTTGRLAEAMSAGIGERGRWGEATFSAILNMSGLVENVNYLDNKPLTKSKTDPLARPDFTIMIGDGSAVAVDSKALVGPLLKLYDEAMDLPDPKMRDGAFKKIGANIWKAVKTGPDAIAKRDYPLCLKEHFGKQGPTFTIVFIPASHVLEMAYKNANKVDFNGKKMSLQEAAYGAGVLLATPTMVMALMTMIKDEWSSYQVDEKTKEIEKVVTELYQKNILFGERLKAVGSGLETARISYHEAVTSYQGGKGIGKTAKRLKELGIGGKAGEKEFPELTDTSDWKNPPDVGQLPSLTTEEE